MAKARPVTLELSCGEFLCGRTIFNLPAVLLATVCYYVLKSICFSLFYCANSNQNCAFYIKAKLPCINRKIRIFCSISVLFFSLPALKIFGKEFSIGLTPQSQYQRQQLGNSPFMTFSHKRQLTLFCRCENSIFQVEEKSVLFFHQKLG